MKKTLEISTMTARNVFASEVKRFIKDILQKFFSYDFPEKAREIHKQDKPYDYRDEIHIYGTKDKGIKYHTHMRLIEGQTKKAIATVSCETFGFDDFWLKFELDTQEGLLFSYDVEDKQTAKKVRDFFDKEFGYCRKQSEEEIFDELIHELRTEGHQNNGKRGIKIGQKALRINPNDYWLHFYLGSSYALNGQHEKAIEHFIKAVDLDSTKFEPLYTLAKSYLELGDTDKALETIKKAYNKRPKNHVVNYYYGLILEERDEPVEAKHYYKQAIEYASEESKKGKQFSNNYIQEAKERLKSLKK
ncbi:MAG: tetratricopeptide repeat protein [Asgard group archaeon]|nr:tetratricopeptide repeat protein [Asgard group archaeon]